MERTPRSKSPDLRNPSAIIFEDTEYQYKTEYFRISLAGNEKFWRRLGGRPPLAGARALDLGCGLGMLCVDLARAGCARVVGLDPNVRAIAWAAENVRRQHPTLAGVIDFTPVPLEDLRERDFDLIVSNQTFEHVMNLDVVLGAVRDHLRPGGRAYIGFGPLYHSPFGHHGWTGTRLPWGHLLLPERVLVERVNRQRDQPITSIRELGLNMLRLSDYRRMIKKSGLREIVFRTNQNEHGLARAFSLGAHVPFLKPYFTHNVYCILER